MEDSEIPNGAATVQLKAMVRNKMRPVKNKNIDVTDRYYYFAVTVNSGTTIFIVLSSISIKIVFSFIHL